jgi:hypothetical protein
MIGKVCLFGFDGGARQTLAPYAAHFKLSEPDHANGDHDWTEFLEKSKPLLMVSGTSDSHEGILVESGARSAARFLGLPVVSIEDFPGNYTDIIGSESDFVFVESEQAAHLSRERLGSRCPRLVCISPARYDHLRRNYKSMREATRLRWVDRQHSSSPRSLMWIGQPETGDALVTLNELLPHLVERGLDLLFRAHPRDSGYLDGAYARIQQRLGHLFRDVSGLTSEEAFRLAPWLVVTQFSSMVVEAGFHGVPSLCLLLPGAGLDRLQAKKGYRIPPACVAGTVGSCTSVDAINPALDSLLEDQFARCRMLDCFDNYYSASQPTLQTSASIFRHIIAERRNPLQ